MIPRNLLIVLALFFSTSLFAKSDVVLNPEKVKALTLAQSVAVQMARLENNIGAQDLTKARSIYDLTLSSSASHGVDQSQRATTIFGTETRTTNYNLEFLQKTPMGTEVGLGFSNERESTNSTFATVNPAHDTKIAATLRQPLLKNFGGIMDRNEIEAVKKQVQALDYNIKGRIQTEVYKNLVDFWRFYGARGEVVLEQKAHNTAYEQYLANQRKLDLGLIEKTDLYGFSANYHSRENFWLMAKNNLVSSTEKMRMVLNLDPDIDLQASADVGSRSFSKLEEVIREAFTARPDYLAKKEEIAAENLLVSVQKNNLWPQLDLEGSLTLNGIDSTYSQALKNIGDGHPAWNVGMEFIFPLQNRLARSDFKKSQWERAKKILELKSKELEITGQVIEKYRQYQNSKKRLSATRSMRDDLHRKWEGEMKKFEQGRSDSDLVIRSHNDYIEAEGQALQSVVDLGISEASLMYAMGRILE